MKLAMKRSKKRIARTMALKYHPDVCPDSESAKVFILLNTAALFGDFGYAYEEEFGDGDLRGRWQDQLLELKRRSSFRAAKKEGPWGCRAKSLNEVRPATSAPECPAAKL
ncbi:hypothetical protein LguiB_021938 [Lonicera macranthoides]